MRLLLDTHTFLWFVAGDSVLSPTARRRIESGRHDKFLSVASIWEIAIKVGLGKIELDMPIDKLAEMGAIDNGIKLLPIEPHHASAVATLPYHHRDPFDRLLVAQALREDMAIVGRDEAFDAYPVHRIW